MVNNYKCVSCYSHNFVNDQFIAQTTVVVIKKIINYIQSLMNKILEHFMCRIQIFMCTECTP